MTAATGHFGTLVLLVFALMAIEPAQAEGNALVECWRHDTEEIGNATRIVLQSGEPGLSWGIDPGTGNEVVGMIPHSEFCFAADGSMTTAHYGHDEGLEDSGTYHFDGKVLRVHADNPGDGWLFGPESKDSRCTAGIVGEILTLADCIPANEWLDDPYTRSPR